MKNRKKYLESNHIVRWIEPYSTKIWSEKFSQFYFWYCSDQYATSCGSIIGTLIVYHPHTHSLRRILVRRENETED